MAEFDPVVKECAWHPQYVGRRHYEILVPLPRGVTPDEFVRAAERVHRVTHGACLDCKSRILEELRHNPIPLIAAATVKRQIALSTVTHGRRSQRGRQS